jgi:hypothetical protein
MIVTSTIVTIMIMVPVMRTIITAIVVRFREIKMIMVYIRDVDAEIPSTPTCINRTVKVICPKETTIL